MTGGGEYGELGPIPPLGERPWDGPDLQVAPSISSVLQELAALGADLVAYLASWRAHVRASGCLLSFVREAGGERRLVAGCPADAQMRHRSFRVERLVGDLDASPERRPALLAALEADGASFPDWMDTATSGGAAA